MNNKPFIFVAVTFTLFIFTGMIACPTSYWSECAKVNSGNSDSSKIKAVVYKEGKGFMAMDKNGNELFEIFTFDNGPDYTSEGFFRIIKNGKIGYADEMGNIAIEPQFKVALPFQNGMAAFCEGCSEVAKGEHKIWSGGKWGFINLDGAITIPAKYDRVIDQFNKGIANVEYFGSVILINKRGFQVKMDNMKFNEWIDLLGSATKLMAKLFFGDSIQVELSWHDNNKFIFSAEDYLEYLRIKINTVEKEELLEYNIIPWQNFSIKSGNDLLISMEEVCTVTDYAVIYSDFKTGKKSKNGEKLIEKFNKLFVSMLETDINNQLQAEELVFPDKIQLISTKAYRYYTELQIAMPGSLIPDDSAWINSYNRKMIYLHIVPDIGEIKRRWIKTMDRPIDTYYTSVEDDLLDYFSEALTEAAISPGRRMEIFQNTKVKIQGLFSGANSYVNFLYDKYEERLYRWLFIDETTALYLTDENIFGDYQPKLSPDNVLDYMPSISEELEKIPDAVLENYSALQGLLKFYQEKSKTNPGQWEEGNMVLGAQQKEYRPSIDELLASETGDRLANIISTHPKEKIIEYLHKEGVAHSDFEYTHFSFTHVDVMGSGRFFYMQTIEKIKLSLK